MVKKNWFNGVAMPSIAIREEDGSDPHRPQLPVRGIQRQPVLRRPVTQRSGKETELAKKNVLIIGAGGVAQVVAHKVAQWAAEFGDLHIATRTQSKADAIIDSLRDKGHQDALLPATRWTRWMRAPSRR